jgi:plasmid stability protein
MRVVAMTLRLTDGETEALRAQAAREGRSMQDVARAAIRVYVNRRAVTREEALRRIVAEDRELLDRLAQ